MIRPARGEKNERRQKTERRDERCGGRRESLKTEMEEKGGLMDGG